LREPLAHPSGDLDLADRDAFRNAAETALASSPHSWGPDSVYRVVVPLWRSFFHPPTFEGRTTAGSKAASRASSSPSRRSRQFATVAASAV